MKVVDINARRYRDFPWSPDSSPRKGVYITGFTERCVMNAIESLSRVFAGQPLHPRYYAVKDGDGWKGIWEPQ